MVFSSLPAYLDPANWQQQPNHQSGGSSSATSLLPLPPPPLPPPQPHGSGGAGSIRPGSMADRARMANIPMPEAAQKCPRCESTNTKFCYFNNYSLSQPRHFCKTCRRYWTKGGALRNVPVGGGCRRNKRSKGSSSKSPVSSDRQTGSGSTSAISSNSTSMADMLGLTPQVPPLRFMAPLHHLSDFGSSEIGLNYGGISISGQVGGTSDLNFHIGSGSGSVMEGLDQWRLQQAQQHAPFLGSGMDSSAGLYPFEGFEASGFGGGGSQVRPKLGSGSGVGSVKMEDNQQLNLSRQFFGVQGNDQYWNTTASAWTDPSGFSSNSTNNLL